MSGLFASLRSSLTAVQSYSKLMNVTANNIANASNEHYSRREGRLHSLESSSHGKFLSSSGVEVSTVVRMQDQLLENSLQKSHTSHEADRVRLNFLQKIETLFQEPSDHGISRALSEFWESWSQAGNHPQNLAVRSQVLVKTESLSQTIREMHTQLENLSREVPSQIEKSINEIHSIAESITSLNREIFTAEIQHRGGAHDLRDQRDFWIKELAKKVPIAVKEEKNGMLSVNVQNHPFILSDQFEKIVYRSGMNGEGKQGELYWEFGESLLTENDLSFMKGELGGLLHVYRDIIPQYQDSLDHLAEAVIREVNEIYANSVGDKGEISLVSQLGYEALGVGSHLESLSLLSAEEKGEIQVTFYDAEGRAVRTAGLVIHPKDSIEDIRRKLDTIPGFEARLLLGEEGGENTGKLLLSMDDRSSENNLGETRFSISRGEDSYDTSGILDFLGFSTKDKSQNDSSSPGFLLGRDITELQTILGEPDIASLRSRALGFSGQFTVNLFETATETASLTDGSRVLQIHIHVDSSDSIDSLIEKVNHQMRLSVDYGITFEVNQENRLQWKTSLKTDSQGNILFPQGIGEKELRISFASGYHPEVTPKDQPPENYRGLGDNTGIFAALQLNTFLQGSRASDIALREDIRDALQLHIGYTTHESDHQMAADIHSLQYGKMSIHSFYEETISTLGSEVATASRREENSSLLLHNLLQERESISGVNLDEELAKMITYQNAYRSNGKMTAIMSQLMEELIRTIG